MISRETKVLSKPVLLRGEVVKGFGRGSKMLGIPTANLPVSALDQLPSEFKTGIYLGWATINGNGPYKMVTSVGWNPYFQNKTMTVEPHLLHVFQQDFYGAEIRLAITGYLRPEANFDNLDKLIEAINEDIRVSRMVLDSPEHQNFCKLDFLYQARRRKQIAVTVIACAAAMAVAWVYWKRSTAK